MAYEDAYEFIKDNCSKEEWDLAVYDNLPLCDETRDDVWEQAIKNIADGIEYDWFYCTEQEFEKYKDKIYLDEEDSID